MISANELRIGNCLLDHNQRIVNIHGIESNWSYLWLNYANGSSVFCLEIDRVNPICITPEILEKCGFVHKMKDCFSFNDNMELRVFGYEHDYNGILAPNIKHLHELQNLYFALTGEELTIKND